MALLCLVGLGLPICSQFTEGRSLGNCVHFINTSLLTTCDQLRNSINITLQVLSHLLTNGSYVNVESIPVESLRRVAMMTENSATECEGVPKSGTLTEIFHRHTQIGLFMKWFSEYEYVYEYPVPILNEIPVRISFSRLLLSDQQLSDLPRFWDGFYYGKCTKDYCWRDILKVESSEGWKQYGLDDILVKNAVVLATPFILILVFRLMDYYF